MSLFESALSYAIPSFGVSVRWLKEELQTRGVGVRLTDACLRELALDAEVAAKVAAPAGSASEPYMARLRQEVATRAEFLRAYTLSDERVDEHDAVNEHLVQIARKYALPRPWKVAEPVVHEHLRRTPNYVYWAGAA